MIHIIGIAFVLWVAPDMIDFFCEFAKAYKAYRLRDNPDIITEDD